MSGSGRGVATDDEVVAEIRRFIAEETLWGGSEDVVTDDQPLVDGGLVDSLELAELVSHLQDRFRVTISPTDMSPADLETVRTISALVRRSDRSECG